MRKLYNKKLIKLLYGVDNYKPTIKEVKYKEKLGYSEEVKKAFYEMLSDNQKRKNLAVAPTGSGKTYLVSEIFDKLIAKNEKILNDLIEENTKGKNEREKSTIIKEIKNIMQDTYYVILCPNKIQNEQNSKYGFKAIVKGVSAKMTDFKLSAVYEKADDIISLKEVNEKARIVMVVDECHQLIDAINYRKNAINDIFKLEKIADTIVYLTATYEPLQCMMFDRIYRFTDKSYKGNTDNIEVIKADNIKDVIDKKILEEENVILALNNKDYIYQKEEELKSLNKKVNVLTSDDKKKNLDNPVYKSVITEDKLLDGVTLATSMFYAGTNVKDYNKDLKVVFTCSKENQMNLDNIEQFFNRFRGKINKAEIITGNKVKKIRNEDGSERKAKFVSLDLIAKNEFEKVTKWKQSYEIMLQALKLRTKNKEYIIKSIRADMEQELEGRKNHLNCLDIDENLNITFNKITFFKNCYTKYQNQFFYFTDKLIVELFKRLNVKAKVSVDIYKNEQLKDKIIDTKDRELRKINAQNLIKELVFDDNKIFNMYIEDKIDIYTAKKDTKVNELIEQEKVLQKLKDMIRANINKNDAIEIATSFNKYVEVDRIITQQQIITNNKKIKAGRENELAGMFGKTQLYIYKSFKVNERVTENKIRKIKDNLNKNLKIKLNEKKITDMINMIFNLDKQGKISSVKTK